MALIVAGTIDVDPTQVTDFWPHAEEMMRATHEEDGCIGSAFHQIVTSANAMGPWKDEYPTLFNGGMRTMITQNMGDVTAYTKMVQMVDDPIMIALNKELFTKKVLYIMYSI